MASVGLEQLLHTCVVSALSGQPVAEVLGDMEVSHREGIRIAVRPLPHLGGGPRSYARQRSKNAISLTARPVTGPLDRPGC